MSYCGKNGSRRGNVNCASKPEGSRRQRLLLASAVIGAVVPCGLALGQTTGTATITTSNGGVTGATIAQPDFSNTNIIGYEDYSNNDHGTAGYPGGPGQDFQPSTAFTLDSVTVKGAGSYGANSPATLAGNWTITIGTVNGNNPYWGQSVTILDQETAVGTPIFNDVTNGIGTNYDMFTLQNQIPLTAGTDYFFAITSNNSVNNSNAWYAFAKGSTADPISGLSALGLQNGPSPSMAWTQGVDFTYFINGTLTTVANNNAIWATNGNGNWSTASADKVNWVNSAPPTTAASTATFGTNGGAITVSPTVNVVTNQQVSTLTLSNPLGYTFAGATVSPTAALVSTAGANTFNSLNIGSASVSISAGSSVTATTFSHLNYSQINVSGGGTLNIPSTTNGSLESSGGSTINITGNGTVTEGAAFLYDIGMATAADTINLGTNNTFDSNSISGPGTLILGAGTTLYTDEYNGFTFSGSLSGSGALTLGALTPQSEGDVDYPGAILGTSPNYSGPVTVQLQALLQVGNGATLGNASSTNTLTFDSGTLQAIGNTILAQNITITDTYDLSNNTTVINTASGTVGNTLTLSGAISGGNLLQKTGIGTLILAAANSYSGGTDVTAGTLVVGAGGALPSNSALAISGGALVQLGTGTGVETLSSLSIDSTSTLDVANNHFYIDYGSGSDPITTIAAYIKSGYNGGTWNGPGIISSAALTNASGLLYGVGYADGQDHVVNGLTSGEIEVKYTLLGDANLDGLVNGSDFNILAANFNQSITGWDQGDFNYDGLVNASDFNVLAANFNQGVSGTASAGDVAALDAFAMANGLSLPTSSVPEPASMGLMMAAGIGVLSRRGRRLKKH
ncbi:MAG: autotransporter-associated beta strand repeat-containing protein [Tepidisphaeraceae bacterium]|jgi:autotransporter-associated beta strand protein